MPVLVLRHRWGETAVSAPVWGGICKHTHQTLVLESNSCKYIYCNKGNLKSQNIKDPEGSSQNDLSLEKQEELLVVR